MVDRMWRKCQLEGTGGRSIESCVLVVGWLVGWMERREVVVVMVVSDGGDGGVWWWWWIGQ